MQRRDGAVQEPSGHDADGKGSAVEADPATFGEDGCGVGGDPVPQAAGSRAPVPGGPVAEDGMRIVLASQSPRRRELLRRAGVSFACLASGVDEHVGGQPDAARTAMAVASRKSHAVLEMLGGDGSCPVLGCDTMVVLGGEGPGGSRASDGSYAEEVFGKPADAEDARRMLRALSGNVHRVISGVSILFEGREESFAKTTHVRFRELDPRQIDEYIDSGEPFDKAGAYGIQGRAGEFVESVESGGYDNVVGLPVEETLEVLRSMEGQTIGKNEVRKQMKAVRKAIDPEVREEASAEVCRYLMDTPEFEDAKTIAAYCAFGTELSFDYLAQNFPEGKVLTVPVTMENHHMEFVVVEPEEILPGKSTLPFLVDPAGLAEIPDDATVVDPADIDIMLVPGLAFDDDGYRLGYGGGYYDVYMTREGFHAARFGTYFEQQHYNGSLPHEEYDVPLPAVITQEGIRRFV